MAVLYRNHHDSILLQGELLARSIPYTVRSGLRFFEQAHIKDVLAHLRIVLNPRDEASWRRVLLLLPGVGPAKAAAVFQYLSRSGQPLESLETAEAMALLPAKSKGFFAGLVNDLKQLRATDPERNPAAAVGAILKGGYPATVKLLYERPDNRIADIEQFTLLAAKYDSLERLIADLLLAGDVYGMDSAESDEPGEVLVLSTVHQAKGLEWSHVFIPRVVEESFPAPPRSRRAGRRRRRKAHLLRGHHPGHERADADIPPDHGSRRPRPDRLYHAQPFPHRDRREPGRTGGNRNRDRF